MANFNRREKLKNTLINSREPIKGQELAKLYNVTRQVIVRDIAILRAEGVDIISTPKGYVVLNEEVNNIRRLIAVNHTREDMEEELTIIIKYGGIVEDVIVDHPVYGEIRGMLMLKNMYDLETFCDNIKNYLAEPLSTLTNGIHLHTVVCECEDNFKKILQELDNKGYLIKEV